MCIDSHECNIPIPKMLQVGIVRAIAATTFDNFFVPIKTFLSVKLLLTMPEITRLPLARKSSV